MAAQRYGAEIAEIGILEFDLGYVAWRRQQPRADATRPPSTVGGASLVIEKETGEITAWTDLGAEGVIEQYRASRPR
jgi:hypothetical protein